MVTGTLTGILTEILAARVTEAWRPGAAERSSAGCKGPLTAAVMWPEILCISLVQPPCAVRFACPETRTPPAAGNRRRLISPMEILLSEPSNFEVDVPLK